MMREREERGEREIERREREMRESERERERKRREREITYDLPPTVMCELFYRAVTRNLMAYC